jgi:hypothetical protein
MLGTPMYPASLLNHFFIGNMHTYYGTVVENNLATRKTGMKIIKKRFHLRFIEIVYYAGYHKHYMFFIFDLAVPILFQHRSGNKSSPVRFGNYTFFLIQLPPADPGRTIESGHYQHVQMWYPVRIRH